MYKKTYLMVLLISGLLIAAYGCGRKSEVLSFEEEVQMSVKLTSTAFTEGTDIPRQYTCDGVNVSPALAWTGIPEQTKSLALIVDDPDASAGSWVHWVLYDIPSDLTSLPEGVQGVGTQGINDFRKTNYGGPCPPRGSRHRYFFKLYALDVSMSLKPGVTKATLEEAMQGHILAQGQLMGIYSR